MRGAASQLNLHLPNRPIALMAGTPKKRKARTSRRPFSREMLLPLAPAKARAISLHNHLALAACRQQQGNIDLVGELLKTVFVTFYLVSGACRQVHADRFKVAQRSIEAMIIRAASEQQWGLEEEACMAVEAILRLHDEQVASSPLHEIHAAKQWLTVELEKGGFPKLTFGDFTSGR